MSCGSSYHIDGVGGGGHGHPTLLQSQQRKWQLWQPWLRQNLVWCGGGDERVLGNGGVYVEAERVAEGVADGVVDGDNLAVVESVLVKRGIQC